MPSYDNRYIETGKHRKAPKSRYGFPPFALSPRREWEEQITVPEWDEWLFKCFDWPDAQPFATAEVWVWADTPDTITWTQSDDHPAAAKLCVVRIGGLRKEWGIKWIPTEGDGDAIYRQWQ